jgi:hypothetical protein
MAYTINEIEDSLNKSDQIYFYKTENYEQEPPLIKLGFNDPQDGISGYSGINELFNSLEVTLVLFVKSERVLDISIVDKNNATAINVKNLKYDKSNFDDYVANEPLERKFMIAIGVNPAVKPHIALPEGLMRPIVFDKYSVQVNDV